MDFGLGCRAKVVAQRADDDARPPLCITGRWGGRSGDGNAFPAVRFRGHLVCKAVRYSSKALRIQTASPSSLFYGGGLLNALRFRGIVATKGCWAD